MREELAGFAASASPAAEGIDVLRAELGHVGETVRTALDGFAASQFVDDRRSRDLEARLRAPAAEPQSSGAVAKLVVSMAEALDFRFSYIEAALGDLDARMQAPEAFRNDDALDANLGKLARELCSASHALRSGLSDFLGASAAPAHDVAGACNAENSAPTTAMA